ncbi:MAG: hypothetical protein LBG90_08740 [Spirochaetaceae bacterium]|jgi:hypothetical protein|nr:hypothetical protein [Spirochaetaceae bacterium]
MKKEIIACLFLLALTSGGWSQNAIPDDNPENPLTPPPSTEPNLFTPESGAHRATLGTIKTDIDGFLDVGGFRDTGFGTYMAYAGFDPRGVTVGFGIKLDWFYFGFAYGGSLIQELIARMTNQSTSELRLALEDDSPGVKTDQGEYPKDVQNRNEFSVLIGFWRLGIKLGFSQIVSAIQPDAKNMYVGIASPFSFENALVPSVAIGASIPIGDKFFIIPQVQVQMDIHQFIDGDKEERPYANVSNPGSSSDTVEYFSMYSQMYTEYKIGGDLGFAIRNDTSEVRFGAGFTLNKRISPDNPLDLSSGEDIKHYVKDTTGSETAIIESVYTNTEFEIKPYGNFSGNVTEKLKLGFKLLFDVRINMSETERISPDTISITINSTSTDFVPGAFGDYNKEGLEVYLKPELDLGLSFAILPERFALHAGFGLNLFAFTFFNGTLDKPIYNDGENKDQKVFAEILPSARFAFGFTVNLTANIALEMLLITSGKFDFKDEPDYTNMTSLKRSMRDASKFTLFLTMKQ